MNNEIKKIISENNISLIKDLAFPILIVDNKGLIISSNKTACNLLKKSSLPDNFLIENCQEKISLVSYFSALIDSKNVNQVYSQIIKYDKEKKIIRFNSSYINENLCITVLKDTTKHKGINFQIEKRLRIEESLTRFFSILLSDSLHNALGALLYASNASSIFLYKNFSDKNGNLCAKMIEEFCNIGIKAEIKNPFLQHFNYLDNGFKRWIKELSKNKSISGNVNLFPQQEKALLLDNLKIEYIVALPIFVDKKWYGFVGFTYFNKKDKISALEIESLKFITTILSSYFKRIQYRQELIKANEDKGIALKQLENALFYKNTMVSMMSHDIKNPLSSIIGFSDLLLDLCKDKEENEETMEYLKIINTSSKFLSVLVQNMSNWLKAASNEIVTPHFDMVSLHIVVEDSISLTLGNATTKKISIINKIPEDTKAWCDSAMMYTVIQNILVNSIKFTNDDGKIVISCKKAPSKNGIVLSIIDNGVGMGSDKAANLFREKQNNSTLGTNGEKGLGLGLIICKEFIEALNGKIWAESSPGNGTTMNIYLRTKGQN